MSYYNDGEVKQITLVDDTFEVYVYFDPPQETVIYALENKTDFYLQLTQAYPEIYLLEKEKRHEWIKTMAVFS